MDKYVIGIDLGGRSAKFGLFTDGGKLVSKSNIVTRIEDGGKYILSDIYDHLLEIIDKYNLDKETLLGIGIGVPGAVQKQERVLKAVNIGWEDMNVKEFFKDKFAYKVSVENDANVAALGEYWMGAGKDFDSLVMVTLGTGVGGGIIVDGKVISGINGSAGEIGHMPILEEPLSRSCGCGGNRCFEQVASATGLENIANDFLFQLDKPSVLRDIDGLLAKDIFDAYIEGDEIARHAVEKYYRYLGRGLAIIGAVVDPEAFVIGGGVSNAGQILIDGIKKEFEKLCFPTQRETKIIKASLGNDAGIYGAAKLVI